MGARQIHPTYLGISQNIVINVERFFVCPRARHSTCQYQPRRQACWVTHLLEQIRLEHSGPRMTVESRRCGSQVSRSFLAKGACRKKLQFGNGKGFSCKSIAYGYQCNYIKTGVSNFPRLEWIKCLPTRRSSHVRFGSWRAAASWPYLITTNLCAPDVTLVPLGSRCTYCRMQGSEYFNISHEITPYGSL